MTLEGAFVDTERGGAQEWFDEVERVTNRAAEEYDIDVHSALKRPGPCFNDHAASGSVSDRYFGGFFFGPGGAF